MASAAVQNKTPRKVLKKSTRDSLIAYSFIAPNFIGFCVFTLVPMVFAIALAFCAWDGRHAIEFVGLKNFVKVFTTDKIFQAALKNTIVYVIGTVPLTLACSLAMAVLLNQNVKLRNFFRTVAFFPYVASLVAVAAVWNMIFNPSMGPINMILNQFFGVAVENLPTFGDGVGFDFEGVGLPVRTPLCSRSSCSACGRTWATTWSSIWPACRAATRT